MDQSFAFLPETKVSVDVFRLRLRSPFTVAGPYRIFTGFPLSRLSPEHKHIYFFLGFFCFWFLCFSSFLLLDFCLLSFAFRPFCFWTFVFSLLLFVLILTLSITIVYFVSYVFLHFYKSLTVFQDFLIENHIKSGFLTLSVLICLSQG